MALTRRGATTWLDTTDPTTSEDSTRMFRNGDVWVNTSSGDIFILTDESAGTWSAFSGGGGGSLDDDLTAIAALTGTGYLVRTAADTWALRTLQEGSGVDLTNPAGTAGDTTITAEPVGKFTTVVKSSPTSRNTTTTLADDPDLILTAPAAGVYTFEACIYAYGDVSADWRATFAITGTGDLVWQEESQTPATNTAHNEGHGPLSIALASGTGFPNDDKARVLWVHGTWEADSNTDQLKFQWAQVTSTGVDVTVGKFSWMRIQRLS